MCTYDSWAFQRAVHCEASTGAQNGTGWNLCGNLYAGKLLFFRMWVSLKAPYLVSHYPSYISLLRDQSFKYSKNPVPFHSSQASFLINASTATPSKHSSEKNPPPKRPAPVPILYQPNNTPSILIYPPQNSQPDFPKNHYPPFLPTLA